MTLEVGRRWVNGKWTTDIENETGGGGGGGELLKESVTLTDAQIQTLGAGAGIEIVPAAGAGKLLRLVVGVISKNFAAAYTNVGTGGSYFVEDTVNEFGTASIVLNATGTASLLGAGNVRHVTFPAALTVSDSSLTAILSGSDLANTNIGFSIDNSLGAFTGGDPANVLTVVAYYVVVDLS